MQPFNLGMRQSSAESVDDRRSRYVPSSVYSGPGPIDDSPALGGHAPFMMGSLRSPVEEQPTPRFAPVHSPGPFSVETVLIASSPAGMRLGIPLS